MEGLQRDSAFRGEVTGQIVQERGEATYKAGLKGHLLRAERKFRRIKGYREIPKLIVALQQETIDRMEAAA